MRYAVTGHLMRHATPPGHDMSSCLHGAAAAARVAGC